MRILLGLTFAISGLIACADEDEPPSAGETESSVVINNKLSANKLSANKLSANKLSANKLSANKLSANRLELNMQGAGELIATADGREVLSFIVSCAINDTETLVAEHDGVTYEFFGELGLANRWLERPLDKKGRGWVSACLFARVNNQNVTVPISLRGPHRQLTLTADEKANWTLQEGAFYGNFFTPANQPIEWIACRGSDQAAGETGGLDTRDCTEPDPANPGQTFCGFTFAGNCGDFAAGVPAACRKYSTTGTFYKHCAAEATTKGGHDDDDDDDDDHHWKHYREVITTYVIP